jgi:hypothetical protein
MKRGRYKPKLDVDINYVTQLRIEKYRWVSIAKKLECSIRQLNTWRKAIGFVDPRIPVDDDDLI